jgi:cyclopropane-fatty-acyl-phospholipid synthase
MPPLATTCYAVQFPNGETRTVGGDSPSFTIRVSNKDILDRLFGGDLYSAAMIFLRGEAEVDGDLLSAVRTRLSLPQSGWRRHFYRLAAGFAPGRLETFFQSRKRAARNLQFHYDVSNEFYRQFLDSRMVYSCAYFRVQDESLDQAQLDKLDHILRKLDVQPGERFLDIGCGWGALVERAAESRGAVATGCTLSHQQFEAARSRLSGMHDPDRAVVQECDFRDLGGRFDKISSVGMFEHVGRHRLLDYFRWVNWMLEDDGLFLNHGIVRPETARDDPSTLFIQQKVFPGGELPNLSQVISRAVEAGFEVLDVENLRPHYARTCAEWVARLQANRQACIDLVGPETYRTWVLFLAGSSVNFERGDLEVHQVLFAKRGTGRRHLTRDYMYTASPPAGVGFQNLSATATVANCTAASSATHAGQPPKLQR